MNLKILNPRWNAGSNQCLRLITVSLTAQSVTKKHWGPWEHYTLKDFSKDEPVPILPELILISKGPRSTGLSKVITIRGRKLPLIECSPHCHAWWHAASSHGSPRAGLFSSALSQVFQHNFFPQIEEESGPCLEQLLILRESGGEKRSGCRRRWGRVFLDSEFITDTVWVDSVPASLLAHSRFLCFQWSRKMPRWVDLPAFTLTYRGDNSG